MGISIKLRFFLVLFLASAILVSSAYLYYQSETNQIRTEENKTLSAINNLKLEQLSQWRTERIGQAKFFPTIGQFIRFTAHLSKNKNDKEAQNYFINLLQPLKDNHNFENVFICNKDCELLFTLDKKFDIVDSLTSKNIKSAVYGDSLVFGEFYYDSTQKQICLDITIPVRDNEGLIIGSFTQIIYPSRYLYPLIQKWPMETRSGETLLAKKINDRVVFLSELRFKDNSLLTQYIMLSDTEVVAVKGVRGERGVIEGKDYIRSDVLAELKFVPGTDWYLISKIDKAEIYSEIFYREKTTIIILVIALLAIIFGSLFFYKSRQSNIYKELFSKEEEFKATLYSIGDAVITTDRNSSIKQMNTVAEKITGWKESRARGKALPEVFVIINEYDRNKIENPVEKVIQTGTRISLANHTLLISKNGEEIPIADSGAPIKDDDGNTIGVVLVFRNQTEERQKEKALFESNEKFSKIFHHSSESISLTQLSTGKLFEINEGFEKVFGYSRSEAIGKTTFELGLWANQDDRDRMLKQLKKNGYIKDFEAVGNRKNGEQLIALLSGEVLEFKDDQYLLLTLRDITERKQTEKILIEKEERLRLSLHAANQGMYDINIKTGNVIVNDEYALMLGYNPSSFEEKSELWHQRLHPDDYKRWEETYNEYLAGKTNEYKIEFRLRTKDDHWKWIMSLGRIVEYDTTGNPLRMLGTHTDITDRKKSEEALKKLSQAVEQSQVSIVITNKEGNVEYINKKFTEVTGYNSEEIFNQNLRLLKSGKQSKEFYKDLWATILSGNDWQGEIQNKRKNGELFWEMDIISPITDTSGNITHFVAVKEDITEKKTMIEELISAKEKAEEMNRAKSSFFANMSHELRTPFVGIIGFAELLEETLSDPEEKEFATKIVKSSRRLTDTLNKILNISRLESTGYDLMPETVNINELIKEIGGLFIQSARVNNTGIKIETEFDDKNIITDKKILEEILNNLLNNAVRFTFNGKIVIRTEKVINEGRDFLKLVVSDTGIGIPEGKQALIWDEFRQVSEGFNRSFDGTGLGLTLIKKFVELLNGTIKLESEEGKGTMFTIEIPVIHSNEEVDNKSELKKITGMNYQTGTSQKPKVLFVDDDLISCEFVIKVLNKQYEIKVANSGDEALMLTKNNYYDLLMLDINLGRGIDGVELMQAIRKLKKYNTVPIVAITAFAAESDKIEFLSKGFSHYISKPFTAIELKDLLAGILTKRN
jgi:PAS domain S-box-containing protein